MNSTITEIQTSVSGGVGLITLNRAKALNALSLTMVQALLGTLRAWRDDPAVFAVAIRGTNKAGAPGSPDSFFGSFCAGGDIRFFHQAALANAPALATFFTEEYTLNHLIHNYPKPYIAFMDGIVMGGGMGICQGPALASPTGNIGSAPGKPSARQVGVVRIVTERTKMAMPETGIEKAASIINRIGANMARDRYRPVSGCRRGLFPEPLPRQRRGISGANR